MRNDKNSKFSVEVSGIMSVEDAGKIATINAWRELLTDVIGRSLVKLVITFSAVWKGGDLLNAVVKSAFP